MKKTTHIAAVLLGLSLISSPLSWAQDNTATRHKATVLSTKSLKQDQVDRSQWISFVEATKKLSEAGYGQIILLKQTQNGYLARTLDNEGVHHYIQIDPEGVLSVTQPHTKHERHSKKKHRTQKDMHRKHSPRAEQQTEQ